MCSGRYKAIRVAHDSSLLEVAHYVMLNPLHARMVLRRRLEKWPWSSYPATCGRAPVPDWLQTDWILAQFGRQRASAIRKDVAFVHEGACLPSAGTQLQGQLIPDRNTSSGRCRRCRTTSAGIRVTRRWRVRIGPAVTPWRRILGCTVRRSERNGEPARGIRTLRGMAPGVYAFFCK